MITLAIDSSTTRGSVAVLDGDHWLLAEDFLADRSHSATLFALLEKARACSAHFDLVAIGLGPGSYAGVRIAISAALGFQLGLGARLVGLPSVAALQTEATEYLVIGDARRESFYFTHVRDGICLQGPLLMELEELRAALASHPTLQVLTCESLPAFPEATLALPSATRLANLAAAGRGLVQHDQLEPIYLREAHITQPKVRPPSLR